MRINPFVYGAVVLALFLGTIGGFKAAGVWSISGKVTASGEEVTADASDVNTIKGWMTLGDVAQAFNVPVAEILQAFDLPADTSPTTAIKDLESDTFDTTALRDWLTARQQGSETGTTAPAAEPAVSVPTTAPTPLVEAAPQEPTPTVHVAADRTLTGKTTFQQVLDWGVSKEAIEKVIGVPVPDTSLVIKDTVTAQGQEFTEIKTALQAEIDKVP